MSSFCICFCRPCFYIDFHALYELTYSDDFSDKHGVLKLMVGARDLLCTIYQVTWYLRLLALSMLTCSPNMSFLLDSFRSILEVWKNGVEAPFFPQTPLKKQFLHGVRVLVRGYLRVRFDLPSSINFRDISGFSNWGPITLIRGHPRGSRVVPLYSTDMIPISHHCTRWRILHRFRDILNVSIFGYLSCI